MTFAYQVGGSLPSNAPSYIERQCDEDYYNLLYQGEYCYVFNCRQMGKSSLRVRVAQKLGEESVHCALIDPQKIGLKVTCDQWYAGAILSVTKDLGLKHCINLSSWLKERDHISPVQRFAEFIETVVLKEIQAPIVIFVEEIDRLLSLSFGMEDFFGLIRSWSEDRSSKPVYQYLTVTFLGVATPNDLFRSRNGSTFNVGKAVEMTGFTINEARPLERGLADKVTNPHDFLEAAVEWTGGQPFLLQKVLKLISQELDHSVPSSTSISSWIEDLIQERIVKNWQSHDVPPHLTTIHDRVLSVEEKMRGSLLGEYKKILSNKEIKNNNTEEHTKLRLTGLAVQQEGRLRSYNPIYAQVFDQNWVQQELNNLRPSFYAEAFRAWQGNEQNESFLLRGDALKNAKTWAKDKHISDDDILFLTSSQDAEEAAQIKANRILQEARDQAEAEQQETNQRLQQANQRLQEVRDQAEAERQKANQMLWDLRDQAKLEQQEAELNLGKINKEVTQLHRQRRRLRWTTYVIATGATLSFIGLITLQFQVGELNNTKNNLEREKNNLEKTRDDLNDQRVDLQKKNSNLSNANTNLSNANRTLQDERNRLKEERSNLVKEQEVLQKDKSGLEKQTQILREQYNASSIELSLSRAENFLLSDNNIVYGLVLALKALNQSQTSNSDLLSNALETLRYALEQSREFNRIDPFGDTGGKDTEIVPLAYIQGGVIFAAKKENNWYLYRLDQEKRTSSQILNSAILDNSREPIFSSYQDSHGKISILVISQDKVVITDGNNVYEDSSMNELIQPGFTTGISSNQDGHVIAVGYSDGTIAARRRDSEGHFSSIPFPKDSCDLLRRDNRYLAVSPNGEAIVFSDGKELKIWLPENASCKSRPSSKIITSLSVHPNSQAVFVGTEDGSILVLPNLEDPSKEILRPLGQHRDQVNSVLVFNQGKLLASSSDDGTIKVWDIDVSQGYKNQKSDPIMNLRGHLASVSNIILDRETDLISGGVDGTIRFWNLDEIPEEIGIRDGLSRACDRLKHHPRGTEVQQICEEF